MKSKKSKIITAIALCAIIVCAVILGVVLTRKQEAQPNAIMELSVNPDVQFLLDENNNVIKVNYLNEDAESLLYGVELKGKSANYVTQKFLELSLSAGYLELISQDNLTPTGIRFDITISCENTGDFTKLKEELVELSNKYFDENGIVAGTVVEINQNLEQAVEKIGVEVANLKNLTKEEILELYDKTSQDLEDIALSLRNDVETVIQNLKETLNVEQYKQILEELENQINDSSLTQELKAQLNEQIKLAKQQYEEILSIFEKDLQEKLEEFRTLSQTHYQEIIKNMNQKREQHRALIEAHNQYFENHKEEVKQMIEEYRQSLQSA